MSFEKRKKEKESTPGRNGEGKVARKRGEWKERGRRDRRDGGETCLEEQQGVYMPLAFKINDLIITKPRGFSNSRIALRIVPSSSPVTTTNQSPGWNWISGNGLQPRHTAPSLRRGQDFVPKKNVAKMNEKNAPNTVLSQNRETKIYNVNILFSIRSIQMFFIIRKDAQQNCSAVKLNFCDGHESMFLLTITTIRQHSLHHSCILWVGRSYSLRRFVEGGTGAWRWAMKMIVATDVPLELLRNVSRRIFLVHVPQA